MLFTLEEGCLGSWPLHRATPLHPDKAQRQQPLTDNSLLPASPSLLHLLAQERGAFSAIKLNLNSWRSISVSLMKLGLVSFTSYSYHLYNSYSFLFLSKK